MFNRLYLLRGGEQISFFEKRIAIRELRPDERYRFPYESKRFKKINKNKPFIVLCAVGNDQHNFLNFSTTNHTLTT